MLQASGGSECRVAESDERGYLELNRGDALVFHLYVWDEFM